MIYTNPTTAPTAPTYYSSGTVSGVQFNGSNNMLYVPSGLFGTGASVTKSDIYFVASTAAIQNSFLFYHGPVSLDNSAGPNRLSTHIPWSDGGIVFDQPCCNTPGGRVSVSWYSTSSAQNTNYVWNEQDNSGGTEFIYRNGSTLVSGTGGTYTQNSGDNFYLGSDASGNANYFAGTLYEMIIYTTPLNMAQRRILLSYLAAKYNSGVGSDSRYSNTTYKYEVGGIGADNTGISSTGVSSGSQTTGTSAGLTLTGSLNYGTYLIAGLPSLNPATSTTTATSATISGNSASYFANRIWYMQNTNGASDANTVTLTFDPTKMVLSPASGQTWVLLYNATSATGPFSKVVSSIYNSGNIVFSSSPQNLPTGYYTIGKLPQVSVATAVTSSVYSDPVEGTSGTNNFPKAIPGAVLNYQITLTNNQDSPDSGSVVITEPVPANMNLFVGNLSGGQPYVFTDGTPASGLSVGSIQYYTSSDGSGSAYTPSGSTYDANVRSIKLTMSGQFNAKTGTTAPSCSIKLQVQIQ